MRALSSITHCRTKGLSAFAPSRADESTECCSRSPAVFGSSRRGWYVAAPGYVSLSAFAHLFDNPNSRLSFWFSDLSARRPCACPPHSASTYASSSTARLFIATNRTAHTALPKLRRADAPRQHRAEFELQQSRPVLLCVRVRRQQRQFCGAARLTDGGL
jgi:hypothetical protein